MGGDWERRRDQHGHTSRPLTMAVVTRTDSPYFWVTLERPGQRPIRESTHIPVRGATPAQTKKNRRLAEAAYASRMGDLARARYQLPIERPRIGFADYRAWYLEHIASHKRNLVRERSMLVQLGAYFDGSDLADIDLDTAREWRTWRARQVAPATVNRELDLVKHLLGTAVPKYLATNPLAGLPRLRVPEREPRILTPDEEQRLLGALDAEDAAFVVCALDTLQRLSSVADVRRAQDHGTHLTFLNTKTKGGKVPVSTRLRRALDALPADGPYLFPRYQGGTVSARRSAILRVFRQACQAAGVVDFTFHGLRHTGASRMLERGVDMETVRRIGGWANLTVLQRYLHPSDEASRRAVEAVGVDPRARAIHAPRRTRKNAQQTRR